MGKYVSPYGFHLSLATGKVAVFPAVQIGLCKENSQEEFSFLVLVDSGAEISLFTKSDAELLGISFKKGEKIKIGSVSGQYFIAFQHTLNMRIGEEKFKATIAFSEKDTTPRVLGRKSIFSRFFIVFDEKRKNTTFIPINQKGFEDVLYN